MAAVGLGTLVLWLSARLIARERQGYPQASPWYFLLGLLAGVGWWSNQLITATLVTAALLFALFMLPRLFVRRALAAAAGFPEITDLDLVELALWLSKLKRAAALN